MARRNRKQGLVPLPGGKRLEPLSPPVALLCRLFEARGWCPTSALSVCSTFDYCTVNFLALLSNLAPRDSLDSHGISNISSDHSGCRNEQKCIAYDLPLGIEYPRLHDLSTQHLTCPECPISTPELCAIILASNLDLKLHTWDRKQPFFAISHIWSDGMGNKSSNSIRLCQLKALTSIMLQRRKSIEGEVFIIDKFVAFFANLIRRTDNRLYFWLDTLCIPNTFSHGPITLDWAEKMKNKSLRHITPVYGGALEVIVIDSGLEKHIARKSDFDEIAARVYLSRWMQRAWTLEEGSIARVLRLKFCDCSLNMSDLWKMTGLPEPSRYWRSGHKPDLTVGSKLLAKYKQSVPLTLKEILGDDRRQGLELEKHYRIDASRVSQLIFAWNNLIERSATKTGDPMIILASILDFDSQRVAQTATQNRLHLLIRSCEELPASILYTPGLVRDVYPDYAEDSWVPQTISGSKLVDGPRLRLSNDRYYTLDLELMAQGSFDHIALQIDSTNQPKEFRLVDYTRDLDLVIQLDEYSQNESAGARQAAQRLYLFIDKSGGSTSISGISGVGAQFRIIEGLEDSMHDILVNYDRPFKIWNPTQWKQASSQTLDDIPIVEFTLLPSQRRVVMQAGR